MTHYEEIHKDKIEYLLQERYRSELTQLREIGFTELHHTREVTFPLSALFLFFMYPIMRANGEVIRIEKPLRYVLLNPLIYNREYDSYAHIFGMGVKFATLFRDETVLLSCNYPTTTVVKPDKKIYRYGSLKKLDAAVVWERHRELIGEIEAKGRETVSELNLDNFEFIMHRDDKAILLGR